MNDYLDENPIIETPKNLLLNLGLFGIDEVSRGICEDNAENRRLLRANQCRWQVVFNEDGSPTNLIQAVTPQMREAQFAATKTALLTDSRDPDSDYITGERLAFDSAADDLVPAWVLSATRHWLDVVDERNRRGPDAKPYRPALISAPHRCFAHTIDGSRCAKWANGTIDMNGLCRAHRGNQPSDKEDPGMYTLKKARARLISASLDAVEGLEELAQTATAENVRLGAYKEILDRAGLRGGIEIDQKVEVTSTDAGELVLKRLAEIAARADQRREEEEAERKALESTVIVETTSEDVT